MSSLPYPAPTVELPRDGGEILNLASLRPNKVVLFFYPKDNTPGCTKEAIGFTEAADAFAAIGVTLVGISKDSVTSHEKFIAKQNLNVILLSDEHGTVCEDFDVWKEKSMYGKTYLGIERSTFLIDGNGHVVREWRKVKVPGHVDDVLAAAKDL
ncbi:MAG: peroxiredoxin [Rhodobacteraceae bacterium]|nr:peroxiredoxin [Paracoccaceae bacterium]